MIRLTVTLCAALWAAFAIWGEPAETTADDLAAVTADTEVPVVQTQQAFFETPTVVTADTPTQVAVTRNSSNPTVPRLIGEPIRVSLIEEAAPAASIGEKLEGVLPLYKVTGNRVNMRSGPSTNNRVVGSMTKGALAEAISTSANGWMEIRDIDTGITGFMSAKFLNAL